VSDELFFITQDDLHGLAGDLLDQGTAVFGPVAVDVCASPTAAASSACLRPGAEAVEVEYRALTEGAELDLSHGLPQLSLKNWFLPEHEAICRWRQRGTEVQVEDAPGDPGPRVVLAAKPCDSAALAVVDKVMNWDYQDQLWNGRREATTIFNLACPGIDESCFCPAVGSAPDDVRGADGLLTPVEGGYLVQAATDKGRALVERHAPRFTAPPAAATAQADAFRADARTTVAANLEIDAESVRAWIDAHFEDPLLASLGVRCNGCGACASVCPTCHCFDIVDEEEGVGRGTRRRCWDTCQTGTFTLHASGHNPRPDQHARYRQRINHKFNVYPLRFGEVLCTGCGRCTRVCHAGQDLVEILAALDVAARRPGAADAAMTAPKPARS
jgi:ferredoxin